MSSTTNKKLQEVDQLIVHGKLPEAYEMINKGLKDKKINKDEELQFLVYKSELEFYFGNFDESIRLAKLVLKENKGVENLLLSVDAYTWKANSYFWNGETNESLEAFEKGLALISNVNNFPVRVVAKHKAQLMSWQAFSIIHSRDVNVGLEIANAAQSLAEKSECKNILCLNQGVIVECYAKLGEWERCKIYTEKALALAKELENKFLLAFSYIMETRTHNWIREFETVEDLFKKAFSLAEEIGSKFVFIAKNDLGNLYRDNSQYNKAIIYYHEALEAAPRVKWMTYGNMAVTYFWKYDLEKAREYNLKSMRYCEEINDRWMLPGNLYRLIIISIELNNLAQAKKYLERLKELSEETGFEQIDRMYRYALISIWKASGKMSDLVKATELLNEFLAEEKPSSGNRLSILYSLLEIRLKELQLSPNNDTMNEVQKQLHHLEMEAEYRQAKRFLANVYRLQSQLALVELDIKNAINLIEKAQRIAEEINVELLSKRIKEDREKIDQQLTVFKEFKEQQASISETVKLVSLDNTTQSIKQETMLEERDQETGEIIEYRKLFALRL
ncbi:MAG: hypothetical protein FK730_11310 [Asgard group archaeon]|nr:hypothetical protein [Asgard group archaeon]